MSKKLQLKILRSFETLFQTSTILGPEWPTVLKKKNTTDMTENPGYDTDQAKAYKAPRHFLLAP